jgi:hypothetical protein
MAAGQGFKTFTTGEVLTAGDVNGYLMQGVLVFASAAARDAAIISPQEGQCCYLKDTDAVQTYSGSAWVGFDDSNAIQNSIVDAKGDIVAASGNDTPARLAVGNNGETLVANSSTSTGLAYKPLDAAGKNGTINGGLDIWQRGTSISVSASSAPYTADRWVFSTGASAASTVSRQSTNDTTNLPSIQYCARVQRNSGQTGTGANYFAQSLETTNSIEYVGQSVTLSFYARKGANFSGASDLLGAFLVSGTGTDQNVITAYTGTATVATSNVTLTSTWQRFTISGTVATTATELAVYFSYTPSGTASTNDYYEITGVQLELGSTATVFSRTGGTIQGELAACQRYFCKTFPLATAPASSAGQAGSYFAPRAYGAQANIYVFYWQFPVPMRAAPTITTYSPSAAGSAWFDEDGVAKTASVSNTSNNATSIVNSATATPNKLALIHATAEIEL